MPVGETVEPVPMPSGEVAPMVGVGLAIPLTCAIAELQTTSAGMTAAINDSLIASLPLKPALPERRAIRSRPCPTVSDSLDAENAQPHAHAQLNTRLLLLRSDVYCRNAMIDRNLAEEFTSR
jgi:hypothetical protein